MHCTGPILYAPLPPPERRGDTASRRRVEHRAWASPRQLSPAPYTGTLCSSGSFVPLPKATHASLRAQSLYDFAPYLNPSTSQSARLPCPYSAANTEDARASRAKGVKKYSTVTGEYYSPRLYETFHFLHSIFILLYFFFLFFHKIKIISKNFYIPRIIIAIVESHFHTHRHTSLYAKENYNVRKK